MKIVQNKRGEFIMEKKLPEFKPLPELGNVASNYMSAFNVGMNIYEALSYLQGYVQITYNSVDELIDDWNNFENYITENIYQITSEKTQEILNQWLSDGTLAETIKQSDVWNEKVNKTGDVMSGDLQFQENTGVYGTLHSGDKVNMISHSYTGTDDYTQIGDINVQAVVRSKARPVWYNGSQNQDLLVEEDLLPKENLLDNADFKSGIINQRNFENTTITGWSKKATVDRWIFSGANNATAEINVDSMGIVGDSSLIQTLSQQYPSGTYTVAANIIALTGTLKISLVYSDDTTVDEMVGDTGLFVHTFAAIKAVKAVMFRCDGSSSSFAFDSIKLEKGSVYTGMPVWNYEIELLKCMRKFQIQEIAETIWSDVTGQISTRSINYFVPMDNTPSITYEVYDKYNVENVSAAQPTKSRYTISYKLLDDVGTGHRYGIRVFIDSENY